MAELGDLIDFQYGDHLPSDEKNSHQNKGQRDFPGSDIGKRAEENHHKCKAAAPDERIGKEKGIEQGRGHSCDRHHLKELPGSVLFFKQRAHQEDDHEVAHQMGPIGMGQNV